MEAGQVRGESLMPLEPFLTTGIDPTDGFDEPIDFQTRRLLPGRPFGV